MIEFKNIIFTDYKMNCLKGILCFFNYLLPLRLKFFNESFAALVDNKIQALITLDKDSNSFSRFKITKLILEEGSSSIAPELTNYVMTRYQGMGATSFYVVVDEKTVDLLSIFKDELNFRMCGYEYLYKINDFNTSTSINLKSFNQTLAKNVCDFYNGNINSYNRVIFSRQTYQFKTNYPKYIFFKEDEEEILGYFEVATKNNQDYYINFSIDCAYNIYLMDAIKFIQMKLKQKNKNATLYIKIKDYFMNSKELLAILNENNMELISKSQILAKDYYREIKQDNLLKNAKIIFNDPTTA